MPYELKCEVIDLGGEMLTVFQASNAMDVERSYLITEASNSNTHTEGDTREEYSYYVSTLLYPSLVACTTGNIPTLDEFMHSVPAELTTLWVDTARKLNPMWFKFITDAELEIEKKEQ